MECSTPGDKGVSRIDSAVISLVICGGGSCGASNVLRRKHRTGKMSSGQRIKPGRQRGWLCRSCGYLHRDWERIEASRNGVWIAQAPFVNHASFHVSGIASPLRRLGDMCVTISEHFGQSGKPFVTFHEYGA